MTESNQKFMDRDLTFRRHCRDCGLEPTRRQASKYRRGKGAAYRIGVLKRKDVYVRKVN